MIKINFLINVDSNDIGDDDDDDDKEVFMIIMINKSYDFFWIFMKLLVYKI